MSASSSLSRSVYVVARRTEIILAANANYSGPCSSLTDTVCSQVAHSGLFLRRPSLQEPGGDAITGEVMSGRTVRRWPAQGRQRQQERLQKIARTFPPLPPVGDDQPFPPGPEGRPLTLADLQKLAVANSPLIKQAAARVEEARGNAIQVGLPPNPTIGF